MNTQRVLLLSLITLAFVGAATLLFRQIWDESHTRFRAGMTVPKDVIPKQLLTQAEINAGGPPIAPDIKPTDLFLAGNAGSPLSIIEFGDYQSDLSKQQDQAIKQALTKLSMPDQTLVVWHDLPNAAEHSKAVSAAVAARCAGEQKKFKEMHDLIIGTAQTFDGLEFLRFARRIGLKEDAFTLCLKDPKWTSTVIPGSVSMANDLAITQVPTIFINGTPYQGFTDAETIYSALKKGLSTSQVKP